MKPKPSFKRGFTLIELLVVITIVAALAALALGMANRGMAKAKGAKAISNMRQIGSLLGTYAGDNNNRLPPARADIKTSSGSWEQLHWFEALATLLYPEIEPVTWRNPKWWKDNKPVLLNPLIDETSKPNAYAWWNPGYAINRQIIANLAPPGIGTNWGPGQNGPQTYAIPLTRIGDPSRTPIVAPRADWHYTYNATEIKEAGLKQFLINDRMPILFIDGHVESMKLSEYTKRGLEKMPR